MHSHDRDARGNRDRAHGRRRGLDRGRIGSGRRADETLARRAYQYGISQRTEPRQGAEQGEAVPRLLGEPEAGVEDDTRGHYARADRVARAR